MRLSPNAGERVTLDAESRPDDPFVGRGRELDILRRLLIAAGAPRHAFVEGEAGIGKTRLVSEFSEEIRGRGLRILRGSCYQVAEAAPYFPFLQILNQLHLAKTSSTAFLQRLAREVAGRTAANALGDDLYGRRRRLLDALTRAILQDTASHRTMVCVEDLQWADAGSLLLLNSLLDQAPASLLVIATARSDENIEVESRQLIARIAQRSVRVGLRGLARSEVGELIAKLGATEWLRGDEQELLRQFTRGNPLFLRELVSHLKESGLLGRRTAQEAVELAKMPEHVANLVDLRLRQLPDDVLLALRVGAVAGGDFSPDVVEQATGAAASDVEGLLDVGVSKGILEVVGARGLPRYRFAHPMFTKRLYDSTPRSLRRRLHSQLARLADSETAGLTVEERARHYALGPGPAAGRRGIEYCGKAAERAEEVLAFETAARFWELALRCVSSREQKTRGEILRRLGWALWSAGKWDRAAEVWQTAIAIFESRQEQAAAAEISLALGDMHRWRQEHAEAERWLKKALQPPIESPVERSRALALLGSLYCLQDKEHGLPMLQEAAAMVSSGGGDPLVTYWLSYGFLVSGHRSRSYAIARAGLKEARRSGDSRATALLAASLFHQELGQLREGRARSHARIVRSIVDQSDPTALIRSLVCEALLLGYGGRWEAVTKTCERWLAAVRLTGRFQVATATAFWAEAQLALGHTEVAAGALRRAVPDLERIRHVAALHLARALVRGGELEEAAVLLRPYSRQLLKSRRLTDAVGRALLGEVASQLEEPKLWQSCYDLLQREEYQMVMAYSPIAIQRVLGRLAGRLGLWAEAFERFDATLEQLAHGQAHGELVQSYRDYAELRRRRRKRGDFNKARALELEGEHLCRRLGISDLRPQDIPPEGNRFGLTGRELEVLGLVATGLRNQEVAAALTISPGTVNRHLENMFAKMQVRVRTEAVMLAVEEGLVGPLAVGGQNDV